MPIASEGTGTRNPIPVGVHHAICYAVIDLGTQPPQEGSQFASRGPSRKVLIMWEFPTERIQLDRDGVERDLPRALSQEYTLSLHEKAGLRKVLESWRGRPFTPEELKGFDLKNVLGANCLISVIHKDNGYEKITAVTALPKGMQRRAPENPTTLYDISTGPLPSTIPPWVQRKLDRALERTNTAAEPAHESHEPPPHEEDEIPF